MDARIPDSLIANIASAVESRLVGGEAQQISQIVREELAAATSPALSTHASASRVVVTTTGRNQPGILARIAGAVDEFRGDIRDLSQTIVGDYFTMLFVIDIPELAGEDSRFLRMRSRLKEVCDQLQIDVVVMHDDILSVMHEI